MPRVKVKDFITIDVPDDMEYSDELESKLFSAIKIGEFAKSGMSMGIECDLEDPYSADRCFVLYSSVFKEITVYEGDDFSNSTLRGIAMAFFNNQVIDFDSYIFLVEKNDLIVGYRPCGEDRDFSINIATPNYCCSGMIFLNDIEEEKDRIEEAERWLKTIEAIKEK